MAKKSRSALESAEGDAALVRKARPSRMHAAPAVCSCCLWPGSSAAFSVTGRAVGQNASWRKAHGPQRTGLGASPVFFSAAQMTAQTIWQRAVRPASLAIWIFRPGRALSSRISGPFFPHSGAARSTADMTPWAGRLRTGGRQIQ